MQPGAGIDARLLLAARTHGHWPAAERAAAALSGLGQYGRGWLALGGMGAILDRPRAAQWRRGATVVGAAYAANTAIKLVVRRRRPRLAGLPQLVGTPTQLSFPSAHATTSFAAALTYSRLGLPRVPLYAVATLVAATRPYLGVHYPSDVLAGAVLGTAISEGGGVSMRVGIVGLPNAGKSSVFNALTGAGAVMADYPFSTIEPRVAVVPIADERLDTLARTLSASDVVYDTVDFHDIAGLAAGAHRGEGLGNRFLANIRETDALVHVVRAHHDQRVVREGAVDPLGDVETVETELILADLEQAERRLERVIKAARGGDHVALVEEGWLRELVTALQEGRPARTVPPPPDAALAGRSLGSLTAKPVLFVVNVDEGEHAVPEEIERHAEEQGARAIAISARLEAELSELDAEEAAALAAEMGLGESGLKRVTDGAFELLGLITFFTAGEAKPAQSWHLRDGLSAWHAAGEIHTDIQRGFVRAEVIGWRELVDAGGYAAARDRGTLRLEGRDYVMTDGDVITIRFTPRR